MAQHMEPRARNRALRLRQFANWSGSAAVAALSLILLSTTASANPDSKPHHRGDGKLAEKIFDKLDADNDGNLSREEVTKARQNRMKGIDKDKDGYISADDLAAHKAERSAKHQERRHARFVEHFDKNDDGRVSVEELQSYESGRFARADTDNDGKISREEWQAARKHHHRMKHGDAHHPDMD